MTITGMQDDTIEFVRVRTGSTAPSVESTPGAPAPTPCPPWCVRCLPPDGRGNDHDGYVSMHIGESHMLADSIMSTSPDGDSVTMTTATVELERLDYAIPGAPVYGPVSLRLEVDGEVMTPEGAIEYAQMILAMAEIAMTIRDFG